jgi:hypothetical protein
MGHNQPPSPTSRLRFLCPPRWSIAAKPPLSLASVPLPLAGYGRRAGSRHSSKKDGSCDGELPIYSKGLIRSRLEDVLSRLHRSETSQSRIEANAGDNSDEDA